MLDAIAFRTAALTPADGGAYSPCFHDKYIRISSAQTGGAVCVIEVHVEQGDGSPLHIHEREDETFHVLEGRIRIRCGDATFEAAAGTSAVLPRDVQHQFTAIAEGTTKLLVQCSPGGLDEFFLACDGLDVLTPDTVSPVEKTFGLVVLG